MPIKADLLVPGRPLSPMERAIWLLDQALPLNGVLVSQVEGPLTADLTRQALDLLRLRHPVLRMQIEAARRPQLVCTDRPIGLRVVARERNDDTWLRELSAELSTPFAPTGAPLCRAVLLPGPETSDLLIAFHHMIGDALSGAYLTHDLLGYAAALLSGSSPAVESLPLRPDLGALLPPGVRGVRRLRFGRSFLLRHIVQRIRDRPRRLRLDADVPPGERRVEAVHRQLDPQATAALAGRCREQGTTVQGALCAAMLLCAAADLGEPATLGCFSGVNLRDRLVHPVDREMGLYISQATTYHRVDPGHPFWDLARQVKAALNRAIAAGEPFLTLPMAGMFIPWGRNKVPRLARRADQAAAAIGVTNLGRIDVPAELHPFRLRNLHGAASPGVLSPLVAVAGTFHGLLSLDLVHVVPLLSADRARALADGAMERLSRAAS